MKQIEQNKIGEPEKFDPAIINDDPDAQDFDQMRWVFWLVVGLSAGVWAYVISKLWGAA